MLSLRRAARRRSRCRGADHRSTSRRRAVTARRLLPTADVAVPTGCPARSRRSSRCSPRSPRRCRPRAISCSSRSGTAFAPWSFAAPGGRSRSRAATCASSTATSPSCTPPSPSDCPPGCIVDGEIVVVGADGLDFDALQQRLHPAASRVAKLALATPASFVAFDLLAAAGTIADASEPGERRAALEQLLQDAQPPLHLTPATRDRAVAAGWLREFEGAGLDGVIAKPLGRGLPAGQAGDAEDQAPAHRRLRRRRPALAQEQRPRAGPRRSARCCSACSTTPAGCITSASPPRSRWPGAASWPRSWRRCAATPSPAIRGATGPAPLRTARRGAAAPARRDQPLERRQGPVLGAAAAGAGLRGALRPPPGRSLPPRHHLPSLAARQAARECRYDQLEVVPPYALKRIFGAAARSG